MRESKRTALLIRCSVEEADRIRAAARRERRTLSGYVLAVISNRLALEERMRLKQEEAKRMRFGGY